MRDKLTDTLRAANITTSLSPNEKSQLVNYMILERAKILPDMQNSDVRTDFLELENDIKHSSFLDGLVRDKFVILFTNEKLAEDKYKRAKYKELASSIKNSFNGVKEPDELANYLYISLSNIPQIHLQNELEKSSLFRAAGDLSNYTPQQLFLLKKTLSFYPENISVIAQLQERVNQAINYSLTSSSLYASTSSEQVQYEVNKLYELHQHLYEKERKFNREFAKFDKKLSELESRSSPDNAYKKVAQTARNLSENLKAYRDEFFNSFKNAAPAAELKEKLKDFRKKCLADIKESEAEFAKFRQNTEFYEALPLAAREFIDFVLPILKALAGVIAFITIAPAVYAALYAEKGFIGTFFDNQTHSKFALDNYKNELLADDGAFEEMGKLVDDEIHPEKQILTSSTY
ncbi:MAG: hypothetical protein H0U70_08495 [Tatlockia sp.]|nr:hypothetical protein [Tatlockia sp.]